MKVIVILSDALRHDYIEYMPFLKEQAQNSMYFENVVPGIGFCEISEYVSGIKSIENGNIFQITFNGKYGSKKFVKLSKLNSFFNRIPRVRRYTSIGIDKYLLQNAESFLDADMLRVRYNIPLDLLNYFVPTESKKQYDDSSFFYEQNLFKQLKDLGLSYDIEDFVKNNKIVGTDEERLNRLMNKIENRKLQDFTLLYIGKAEMAHFTGTKNETFHSMLKEYDKSLKLIYNSLNENYSDEYRLVILGDHGMVDVKQYINILPEIKKIQKKYSIVLGRDFMYFIDSTAFRIWVKDKNLIRDIKGELDTFLSTYVDDIELQNSYYGDLIYILKPTYVFFPDFFNTKKNKGMHGYRNTIEDQHGLCVIMGEKQIVTYKSIELHNIKEVIMRLFQ